jgi:glycosyltransferase involved in cell wall biosynthesis
MKLALLKGNRFNPWHLQAFNMLRGGVEVTAFRAESEIQNYFHGRDDGSLSFAFERIYFDTEGGPKTARFMNRLAARFRNRAPRLLPFHERLEGYDVIQSWELFTDWTAEAVAAKRKYGIPLCLMIWDNIPFNQEADPGRRAMKEEARRHADRFLVHTERSRRTLLMEGADPERITLVNPGVDTQAFAPGPSNRGELGLDDHEFVILFVGWLLPRKGIDFLVLALRELLNQPELQHMKFRLLVVGSGPGKDRVEALIERAGVGANVTFAGSQSYSDMPAIFRAADAFVLPSIATPEWQEQFGMSLIEAMASGVPVVSTYSGAIPEIAGSAAELCQPNDFLALYTALKKLALEPETRENLARLGRERALAHFRQEDYASALSDVYESLT